MHITAQHRSALYGRHGQSRPVPFLHRFARHGSLVPACCGPVRPGPEDYGVVLKCRAGGEWQVRSKPGAASLCLSQIVKAWQA